MVARGRRCRVHRPARPVERYEQRHDPTSDAGQVFSGLTALIRARTATPEFAGGELIGFDAKHPAVLGYQRPGADAVVLVLALWFRPESRDTAWLAVPVAAVIVLFVAGLTLAVAALNAVFRDVEFIISAALLPWFFLTPILYQLDDLPGAESHPWLVDLIHWGNPVTPAIEAFRTPLYTGELPPAADTLYLCVAAVVALVVGALTFNAVDDRIASEA